MILSILIFISGTLSTGMSSDCAHLDGTAVDQCIVLEPGKMNKTFGESEAVALSIACETFGDVTTWTLNGFKNKRCTSKVNDNVYPMDISSWCSDEEKERECVCGEDKAAEECYITVSDYKDCDENGKYDIENDLLLQYSVIVGECVAVSEDNEKYDAANPKWELTECNDDNNIYNSWTTTIYEDAACLTEYKELDLDCSSLTSESVTCGVTADVIAGYYCGRFEGHPLGVCTATGTFVEDSGYTYYESSMYFCDDAETFKKITYLSTDCTGTEKDTEKVDCGIDHNCVCDVDGGKNDGSTDACGYNLFSYTAQGPCMDKYHGTTGNVDYTVILEEDMCAIDDEHLNGVKYSCGSGASTPSDLTFIIYPDDVTCSGDTYCAHTRTVDCSYSTPAAPISCNYYGNYYGNYPIGVCSRMKTYIDSQGTETAESTMYECNSDGSIQTNVFSNLNCNATGLLSSKACTECTTDDRGRETCDDCQGFCAATTSDCTLAQVHQNLVCKLIADDSGAEEIYYTELLVLDECQSIASKYRMDTCSGTVITQTVFNDNECSDPREACSISIYEGDYGLDYEEHHSAVTNCIEKSGATNGECGYIDQYPIDTCIVSYTDQDGVSFSAKYSCSEAIGDEYTVSVYRSKDCTGDVIHTETQNCTAEGIECNCGGTKDECDLVTVRLTDTCLETETFLTVLMPDQCQKIEDIEVDWSLYLGMWCDDSQENGITFAIYEDSECKKQANALRYKDDGDCTHYMEWDGVCGAYDDGRGFFSSNANNVQLLFATAFIVIFSLFLY